MLQCHHFECVNMGVGVGVHGHNNPVLVIFKEQSLIEQTFLPCKGTGQALAPADGGSAHKQEAAGNTHSLVVLLSTFGNPDPN